MTREVLSALEEIARGPLFRFADWPVGAVPQTPGIYTIWQDARFLYVGMAGRGQASTSFLRGRLQSHASGRRSGDQFCIYVCDRLVLPQLTARQLADIGDGKLSLDAMTHRFIHERLSFRFVSTADGPAAYALEREIKRDGLLAFSKPLLNPDLRPD